MTLETIQSELDAARKELDELNAELPQYHALLAENEREVQELRESRAALDKQAQAKGRATVARELLEQHQADITAAQGKVARLEEALARGRDLARLSALKGEYADLNAAWDENLVQLAESVEEKLREVCALEGAIAKKHAEFNALAGRLGVEGLYELSLHLSDALRKHAWSMANDMQRGYGVRKQVGHYHVAMHTRYGPSQVRPH